MKIVTDNGFKYGKLMFGITQIRKSAFSTVNIMKAEQR